MVGLSVKKSCKAPRCPLIGASLNPPGNVSRQCARYGVWQPQVGAFQRRSETGFLHNLPVAAAHPKSGTFLAARRLASLFQATRSPRSDNGCRNEL
jgi:hypothetical protein